MISKNSRVDFENHFAEDELNFTKDANGAYVSPATALVWKGWIRSNDFYNIAEFKVYENLRQVLGVTFDERDDGTMMASAVLRINRLNGDVKLKNEVIDKLQPFADRMNFLLHHLAFTEKVDDTTVRHHIRWSNTGPGENSTESLLKALDETVALYARMCMD